MKRLNALFLLFFLFLLSGCNNAKIEELEGKNAVLLEKQRQDSIYISGLTTEMDAIYSKLDSMREMENRIRQISADMRSGDLSGAMGGASISQSMKAIDAQLRDSRARIRELEARLQQKAKENSNLSGTVKSLEGMVVQLRKTIDDKDQTIADLQMQIESLQDEVAGLTVQYTVEVSRGDSLQTGLDQTKLDLNTAYYIIGTNRELKKKDVLVNKRRGFESDRNLKHFTKIDIREEAKIAIGKDLKARKIDLVPERPESSYKLVEEGGMLYLQITDKGVFWQDKFLAIVK